MRGIPAGRKTAVVLAIPVNILLLLPLQMTCIQVMRDLIMEELLEGVGVCIVIKM